MRKAWKLLVQDPTYLDMSIYKITYLKCAFTKLEKEIKIHNLLHSLDVRLKWLIISPVTNLVQSAIYHPTAKSFPLFQPYQVVLIFEFMFQFDVGC